MGDLTALQQLASPLVGVTSLVEIRLFESHGRHVAFPSNPEQVRPADLQIGMLSPTDDGADNLVYLLQAEMRLVQGDGDEDEEWIDIATFSVTFGALYTVHEQGREATSEQREAFGQCVASLALWPYVRAEMAHLAEAMHSPMNITLPMLSQEDLVDLM